MLQDASVNRPRARALSTIQVRAAVARCYGCRSRPQRRGGLAFSTSPSVALPGSGARLGLPGEGAPCAAPIGCCLCASHAGSSQSAAGGGAEATEAGGAARVLDPPSATATLPWRGSCASCASVSLGCNGGSHAAQRFPLLSPGFGDCLFSFPSLVFSSLFLRQGLAV